MQIIQVEPDECLEDTPGDTGKRYRRKPRVAAWRAFVRGWWSKHQRAVVTVADLFPLAETALGLEGSDENSKRMRLGNQLSERRDRVYGHWKIVRLAPLHGVRTYRLESVQATNLPPSSPP
jgi:hypothetical protein